MQRPQFRYGSTEQRSPALTFVTPGAATSSPGMAFLLATVAAYGDDWPDYWERLMANGAKLTEGWSDITGSRETNTLIMPLNHSNPGVFFRLAWP